MVSDLEKRTKTEMVASTKNQPAQKTFGKQTDQSLSSSGQTPRPARKVHADPRTARLFEKITPRAELVSETVKKNAVKEDRKPVPNGRKRQAGSKTSNTRGNGVQAKKNPGRRRQKVEKPSIRVIFLGGLNEIGKNMTLFECEDDMFLLDCGMAFPDGDMLGVDLVLPDFTYVERNKDKIRGIVLTHGHEDHIGSLPYL